MYEHENVEDISSQIRRRVPKSCI